MLPVAGSRRPRWKPIVSAQNTCPLVSTVSLCGNAGGEWALVRLHLQYVVARVIASTVVGIGWNFPMHRHFVFRSEAPVTPGAAAAPSEAPQK